VSALRRRALANSYDFFPAADSYAAGNNFDSLKCSPRTIMAQAMREPPR
jgi:hypothetical protein